MIRRRTTLDKKEEEEKEKEEVDNKEGDKTRIEKIGVKDADD
jgi:hypothetical protein